MNFSPYYRIFSLWLVALTVIFNLIGMLSNQIAQIMSMMILLPYMIAFFIMCTKYAKNQATPLEKRQRWRIAITCAGLFWLYTVLTSLLAYIMMNGFNFQPILQAFQYGAIILFSFGAFLCLNALITGLGYYFLGKPLSLMQKVHSK